MMAEELAKKRTKIRGGHRAHIKRVLDDVGTTLWKTMIRRESKSCSN